MNVKLIGRTDAIITLNSLEVVLQGRVDGNFKIETSEQEAEINFLEKAGLIKIELLDKSKTENIEEEPKKKRVKKVGRPKGSKNKPKRKTEQEKALEAEAETQKMGAEVVIATGKENVKIAMKSNFADEVPESEATKASIEAMEKLEEEELAEKEGRLPDDAPIAIDESTLDPSEQMGRTAVVVDSGSPKESDMKNSYLPGSEEIKERDPFIDREEADNEDGESEVKSEAEAETEDEVDMFEETDIDVSEEERQDEALFVPTSEFEAPVKDNPLINEHGETIDPDNEDDEDPFIEV